MPTPTIDPVVYEAAYAAIQQHKIERAETSLIFLVIVGAIWFFAWLFKED